jgi:predicted amidohydrolase
VGGAALTTANQYHSASDFPQDYPPLQGDARAGDKPEVWSRGGSAIVGPLGDVLAGPLWDKEGILYADVSGGKVGWRWLIQIDTSQIDGAKLDFDPIGHYAREPLLLGLLNAAGQQ